MALLEELAPGVLVKGLLPAGSVTIISTKRHGSIGIELVYQDAGGNLGSELLYSDSMANLEIVPAGLPWSFDADGASFRLTSEAYRIRLAYLFDPLIAVHTSLIEPLPHQITADYETMLGKQPLRYLLADDPGAGKTIMAGLLIKELMIRGDLRRCAEFEETEQRVVDQASAARTMAELEVEIAMLIPYLPSKLVTTWKGAFLNIWQYVSGAMLH